MAEQPDGGRPRPVLAGRLVRLRPGEPGDAARLRAILAEPSVSRWWGEPDPEAVLEADMRGGDDTVLLVMEVGGEVAGGIQYAEEDTPMYRHAGIDIFLGGRFQGRGVGTEAVRLLARFLFEQRGHHRITIDPAAANAAAIRSYTKVGFRPVGVMRQYERGGDGQFHDGLLMDLLRGELTDSDGAAIGRLEEAVRRLAEVTAGRERRGLSHEDADDVTGTAATDDAIGFNPLPLLRALHEHGAVVAIMGQVAGIMHGSRDLTGDLDLLWDGDQSGQAPALAAGFAAAGASLADEDGRPVPCDPASFGLPKVLFRSALASGDCCTPALPWGDLPVADFLARCRVATTGDGLVVRYLDRADLIRMRRAVGRPKDLRRADELERLAP